MRRTSAGLPTHAATAAASSATAAATPSSAALATSTGPWWLAADNGSPQVVTPERAALTVEIRQEEQARVDRAGEGSADQFVQAGFRADQPGRPVQHVPPVTARAADHPVAG